MASLRRREGTAKLTGRERYVDDLVVDGCLWGMTVRSPSPRGRISGIHFDPSVPWDEFVVVDHRDIPGANVVFLIEHDQPVLAAETVRHVHEPVVLIAHPSRERCREAVRAVTIEIAPEPPVLDYRQPPTPDRVQFGADNVFKDLRIDKGDVDAALRAAAHIIEGTYETGAQEHVYLETNGMIAWEDDGVMTVKGSMQCPYYVLNAVTHALGRTPETVRVLQAPTGGGFGGKEDFPSNLAVHAALLALRAGRPVKMIYDRGEDMAATTKRHPAVVRHRTAVDADGRLVAQDIDMLIDGGAYVTLSPVVLSRAIIHAAGPYSCPNVRIRGRAVLSNAVPFGAFRGFGAPQSQFANERHMDVIAAAIGLDPIELRRRNLIRDGATTATGQVIDDGADRVAVMDRALDETDFRARRRAHDAFNAEHPYLRRGMGLATVFHGSGFTGAGEVYLKSELHIAGRADGSVEILSANTEIGQGTLTIFVRIAAERLGLEPDDIHIAEPDTARVPNSGPTVASRTAMVVGHLIERACDDLRANVGLPPTARGATVQNALRTWCAAHPGKTPLGRAQYRPPPDVAWDEETYRGHAYGVFAWAAYVAEVEVDLRTWTPRVLAFHTVQEVGTVLNATLARGQIQGGVVQAIGWALTEECRWQDGAMCNNGLTNYIIPTTCDVPPIGVTFLERPYAHGALGAKGLGELPMDAPAPAIANAVARAIGVPATAIPLTPERLREQMHV